MKYYNKLVPFDIAVKAKEKGYNKDYGYQYGADGELCDPAAPCGYEGACEAPTYADLFDWLAERNMFVSMFAINTNNKEVSFIGSLMDISNYCKYDGSFGYEDSFDDAARPAIEKALELIS